MMLRLNLLLLLLCTGYAAAESYVFTNGNLITMTDSQPIQGELVVLNGRITAVGQGLRRPNNATIVDMDGGYLMPGLAEMHAHVPNRNGSNSSSSRQSTQYRDDVLFLWVAAGITTARGMLGHPDHLQLREDLMAHKVLGPRLITSGPSFNGRSVTSISRAVEMVEEQAAAGYDFLKIHPGMSRDQFDAMAETAHRVGIDFAGHVPADVGLVHALARGQRTIDHLDGYVQELVPELSPDDPGLNTFFGAGLVDQAQERLLDDIVAKTLAADAWVVPTETLLENFAAADRLDQLLARHEIAYLPKSLLANYQRALTGAASAAAMTERYVQLRKKMLYAMHEQGVGILLGSDSPQIFNVPGFSIHRELAATVAAGLSPYEALVTGTLNPARFFGLEDEMGRLKAGMVADLVLVAGNPLRDISNTANVRGTMVRGRWVNADERETKLAAIAERYAN